MKTSTVNGVTYELPEGWEPIETVPCHTATVYFMDADGEVVTSYSQLACAKHPNAIAWQPITPPKVVRRFEAAEKGRPLSGPWTVTQDGWREVAFNIPTKSAAQAIADIYEKAYGGKDE